MTPPLLHRFTLSVWTVFYGPKSKHLFHEMSPATRTDQRELGLLKIVRPMANNFMDKTLAQTHNLLKFI